MHIQTFITAKKLIDSKEEEVVGGFLLPSTDFHVSEKLGNNKTFSLSLKQRNEINKIAIKNSNFIENIGSFYYFKIL
jgi:hypothetical protein